ncbi:hypothetical protein OBBRIDRAFT_560176 [Obba rivulosa]|uniref:CCHC-type domain-containing protein n=1 Tax=Obba rivulosa TaxID=1052685 RepID=A0A8E2AMY2_9APHY|nr:hypothetical protein OBBRIDRAFT_560176 [Obba rivulosa]
MAMSFEEARRKKCCARCNGKGHMARECLSGKNSTLASGSSNKSIDATASSSKASMSTGKKKDKDKDKDKDKVKYTKKSVREVHGSDSDRFEELDSEDGSGSSLKEETPKPKKKKLSLKKAQKVNCVVFSDNKNFLKGPM